MLSQWEENSTQTPNNNSWSRIIVLAPPREPRNIISICSRRMMLFKSCPWLMSLYLEVKGSEQALLLTFSLNQSSIISHEWKIMWLTDLSLFYWESPVYLRHSSRTISRACFPKYHAPMLNFRGDTLTDWHTFTIPCYFSFAKSW